MEDAERRRVQEKDRRLQEQFRVLKEKQEVTETIAARAFSQSYLQSLMPSVYENLSSNGYFYDKIERELESSTLPWLTAEVTKKLELTCLSMRITDGTLALH
jgi:radial spoke head protein 3